MRDLLFIDDLQVVVYYNQRTDYYSTEAEGSGIETLTETTLEQVDFELLGDTIDILPCLSEKQKERIVRQINKEHE